MTTITLGRDSFDSTTEVARLHEGRPADHHVEWNEPEALARYEISGSNMAPALERLSIDHEVEAAVIVTDGDIECLAQPVPYQVLWALTTQEVRESFRPAYGHVLILPDRSLID